MNLTIKIRQPNENDVNFVYNSWLKSYRNSPFASPQCNAVYYKNYKAVITSVLERSLVLLACNPEDEDQVYGYIVYEQIDDVVTCVHFVYTKYTYRGFKVAKSLYDVALGSSKYCLISHWNEKLKKAVQNRKIVYDPFIALLGVK